jgi:hypothetical protein
VAFLLADESWRQTTSAQFCAREQGDKIEAPRDASLAKVIDLMDALCRSDGKIEHLAGFKIVGDCAREDELIRRTPLDRDPDSETGADSRSKCRRCGGRPASDDRHRLLRTRRKRPRRRATERSDEFAPFSR